MMRRDDAGDEVYLLAACRSPSILVSSRATTWGDRMDLSGEYRIPAPREAVWKALNDADVLKECIPGCESVEKTSDTEFNAKVRAKVGPVSAAFTGKVTLSDLDPPNGYKISGEGQGGVAGFARGGADVRLKPDDSGTGTILT
jgi:carbon monoxide dehydrogenase subunit G